MTGKVVEQPVSSSGAYAGAGAVDLKEQAPVEKEVRDNPNKKRAAMEEDDPRPCLEDNNDHDPEDPGNFPKKPSPAEEEEDPNKNNKNAMEEQHPPLPIPPRPPLVAGEDNGNQEDEDDSSAFISVSFSNQNENGEATNTRLTKQQEHEEMVKRRLKEQLNKQDKTKAVRITRTVVLLFLFATASVVSVGTYLYASHKEQQDFATAFEIHATQLLESFSNTLERRLVAFGTLANTITNCVEGTPGVEWPFVTVPNFEVLGADFRVQGGNAIVHFMPMITSDTKEAWESYALEHRFQIDASFVRDKAFRETQDEIFTMQEEAKEGDAGRRSLQETTTAAPLPAKEGAPSEAYNMTIVNPLTNVTEPIEVIDNVLQDGTNYSPKIWFSNPQTREPLLTPDDQQEPMFPIWQRSPVNANRQGTLNLNMMQGVTLKGILPNLLQDPGKVLINRAIILSKDSGRNNFKKNLLLSQYRFEVNEYNWDPISFAVYPIFDDFFNASQPTEHHREHLAGVLVTNFYWRLYFQNILPPDVQGIICVLRNSFQQTFSYRIDGPTVTFLGEIDPIELYERYEHMGIDVDATSYVQDRAKPDTRSYTTVPLSSTFGVYTLHVYPSIDTKKQYTSNQPFLFCWVVAAVFFFTVLVFLLFDWLVERRQRILMNRAIQSGALVSSLFPEQVQDRLYQERAAITEKPTEQQQHLDPISRALGGSAAASAWKVAGAVLTNHNPLNNSNSNSNINNNNNGIRNIRTSSTMTDDGGQIADVYNDTTIFFADLAGFTAWSSTRLPKDVFRLLETLYSAFDEIAERRNVYKIETIGDCYVAITGCPDPQKEHAVIMVKFARDCMQKMGQLTHDLADTLGEDTTSLGFRVGVHSGPVTAGVLRGQKARFQLFGDSVNKASRMESLGVPGKIHCSEETANQLINSGKQSWLTPREDKITAKGLGTLQTYFVQVASSPGTSKTCLSDAGL